MLNVVWYSTLLDSKTLLTVEFFTSLLIFFFQDYILELRMLSLSLEVLGGFYLHPHRIEQILSKCCSDWEARSAGAAPVASRQEQQAQIFRDIPHSSLRIDKMSFQPLVENENRDNHIKAKKVGGIMRQLVMSAPLQQCSYKKHAVYF